MGEEQTIKNTRSCLGLHLEMRGGEPWCLRYEETGAGGPSCAGTW